MFSKTVNSNHIKILNNLILLFTATKSKIDFQNLLKTLESVLTTSAAVHLAKKFGIYETCMFHMIDGFYFPSETLAIKIVNYIQIILAAGVTQGDNIYVVI